MFVIEIDSDLNLKIYSDKFENMSYRTYLRYKANLNQDWAFFCLFSGGGGGSRAERIPISDKIRWKTVVLFWNCLILLMDKVFGKNNCKQSPINVNKSLYFGTMTTCIRYEEIKTVTCSLQ